MNYKVFLIVCLERALGNKTMAKKILWNFLREWTPGIWENNVYLSTLIKNLVGVFGIN